MKRQIRWRSWVALVPLAAATVVTAPGTAPGFAGAQEPTALLRVVPEADSIDLNHGDFSVNVDIANLDHHATVAIDDDRDTVPDREAISEGLGAFEFLLRFDPAVLQAEDMEIGGFWDGSDTQALCLTDHGDRPWPPGQVRLGCISFPSSVPGPQGSGTLAIVTFRPLARGSSSLELEGRLAGPLGDPIPVTVAGGSVEIVSAQVTSTPTPQATAVEPRQTPAADGRTPRAVVALPPTGRTSRADDLTTAWFVIGELLAAAGLLFVAARRISRAAL